MWVKICGTTNLDDAQAAVDAGADALGFIFAESPRRVQPAVAAEIARTLPEPVDKIGVFVNESAERIRDIVEEAGLTGVQLHADESLEAAGKIAARLWSRRNLRVIAAVSMRRFRDLAIRHGVDIVDFTSLDTVIFDTLAEDERGGTGLTWDWKAGKSVMDSIRDHVQTVVAGGLTPANVADVIRILRPWGVDVASGVERQPGKKDHEKVRAFVKAAKTAACQQSL